MNPTQPRLWALPRWTDFALSLALPLVLISAFLGLLTSCASLSLDEIKPGVSTEAEVRERMGEPGRVWPTLATAPPNTAVVGAVAVSPVSRVLEYSRQPYGHTAHMVDIGADGKVLALRQVLTAENFKNVVVGLSPEAVLRMLGKPMAVTHFPRKQETYYDWRYLDGRQWDSSRIFYAVFDAKMQVVSTGSIRDPDLDPKTDPWVMLRPMQQPWVPQRIRGSHG